MRNSLPAWVKSRIQLGAREPGTPGRRAAEGEGTAPAPSRGTSRGPRGRGRGAPPAWAALGLRPHSRAAPRGYCLECAGRALRPPGPHRPEPEPTGRAGWKATVRRAVRPAGPVSTARARALRSSRRRPCARLRPPSPRPRRRGLLRSSRSRAGGPGCFARRRATFTRAGDGEGRRGGGEKGGGGPGPGRGGGSFCLTDRGGNSATAPAARGPRLRAAAEVAAAGAGRPPARAPQPPTARRRPARASQRARGLRGRRRRRGGAGRGPRAGGEARGGRPAPRGPGRRAPPTTPRGLGHSGRSSFFVRR